MEATMRWLAPNPWQMLAAALAAGVVSCSDFSQHRIGGVRVLDADGPPRAAPALAIASPPTIPGSPREEPIKQVAVVPEAPAALNPQINQQALRLLHQKAVKGMTGMDTYVYRLRRREAIGERKTPEEVIRVAIRREPYSVHLKWVGNEAKGRETVYVQGKFDNEMQVLLAAHDAFPLSPAGIRWSIAANDSKARARSRYPITDTGLASLVERFGVIATALERGEVKHGTMKYLGQLDRPEFNGKVEGVVQVLPPKSDPNLPKGGQRWWFFDVQSGLPVLIIAHDPDGEAEYYCHDHIQAMRLGDDDFNPDKLWRK